MRSSTYESGLRFIQRPTSSAVVYVGIAIGVGTRHEKRGEHGLAHFVEHMLFKGTSSRSSKQIIVELEEVGGEVNAYTSKEDTVVYAICPREYSKRAISLLADLVQNSIFTPEELEKEQTVVVDEVHSYEDSPSELIWDEFEDILFHKHALGHSVLGTEKSIMSFTQKKLMRFYREHYRPENMVVFVQGDIEYSAFEEDIKKLFVTEGNYTPTKCIDPALPLERLARRVVRKRGTSQRHILMGTLAYSMFDKRRLGLKLLVNVLGGPGMSSRLNMSLREESGFAYNVDCYYTTYSDTGFVAISFGCASKHEEEAIALVHQELKRMAYEGISEEELSAAKRQFKGQMIVASDNYENRFLNMGKSFLHYGKVSTLEESMQRIDELDVYELREIAHEIFQPEYMSTLIYR